MTKTDDEYYENFINMFTTPGWKQLIEDTVETIDALERRALYNVTTMEQFHQMKGRLLQLITLRDFEQSVRSLIDERGADVHTQ